MHKPTNSKRIVTTWANQPEVSAGLADHSPGAQHDLRQALRGLTLAAGAPSTAVVDAQGTVQMAYPLDQPLLGRNYRFRDWYRGVSSTDAAYVSEGYMSVIGRQVVAVAAPVHSQGRTVGYLYTLWELTSIATLIKSTQTDGGITLEVFDQQAGALTGNLNVDGEGEADSAVTDPMVSAALAGRDSSQTNGDDLRVAGPVQGLGWAVLAEVSRGETLAGVGSYRRHLVAIVGVALALVVLLSCGFAWLSWKHRQVRHAEENRFRQIFDDALIGNVITDAAGVIRRSNSELARCLGVSTSQLEGRKLADFAACTQARQALNPPPPGQEVHTEVELRHAQGTPSGHRSALPGCRSRLIVCCCARWKTSQHAAMPSRN